MHSGRQGERDCSGIGIQGTGIQAGIDAGIEIGVDAGIEAGSEGGTEWVDVGPSAPTAVLQQQRDERECGGVGEIYSTVPFPVRTFYDVITPNVSDPIPHPSDLSDVCVLTIAPSYGTAIIPYCGLSHIAVGGPWCKHSPVIVRTLYDVTSL
jgi:hypothetical protein